MGALTLDGGASLDEKFPIRPIRPIKQHFIKKSSLFSLFVHISFVTLCIICIFYTYPTTFSTQNKLLYIKLFFMKKQLYFEQEYVAPELEVISMSVEAGFSLSMGIAEAEEDWYGDF